MTVCNLYPYNPGKRTKGNQTKHHYNRGAHLARLAVAERLGFVGLSLEDPKKVAVLKNERKNTYYTSRSKIKIMLKKLQEIANAKRINDYCTTYQIAPRVTATWYPEENEMLFINQQAKVSHRFISR